METLYCPKCGYNLTGLTRNVCPECGNPFDPAAVADRQAKRRPRFIYGVLYVLAVPAISVALVGLSLYTPFRSIASLFCAWYAAGPFIALYTSTIAGRRFARRLARKHPDDPPTPVTGSMTIFFAFIFFVCQMVIYLPSAIFAACGAGH